MLVVRQPFRANARTLTESPIPHSPTQTATVVAGTSVTLANGPAQQSTATCAGGQTAIACTCSTSGGGTGSTTASPILVAGTCTCAFSSTGCTGGSCGRTGSALITCAVVA